MTDTSTASVLDLAARFEAACSRIGDSGPNRIADLLRALAAERDALRKLVEDHNTDCQSRCGVGDQEAVRCGWRPYFVNSNRRCPECPTYEMIYIPAALSREQP